MYEVMNNDLRKTEFIETCKRRMDKMIGGSSSSRGNKSSQRLMFLVLALGMATVSVMLLGKLRESRVFGLLVRDQDQQIMTLQIILERERETSKALKRKLEAFRSKIVYIKSQNAELSKRLIETQTTTEQQQNIQQEMEKSLGEKQQEIESLSERLEELDPKVAHLTELLEGKEIELKEVNEQLDKLSNVTESVNQDGMKSEQHEETMTEEVQTNQKDDNGNKDNNEMSSETTHGIDMKEVKEHNEAEKSIENKEEAKEVKNIEEKVDNNVVQENDASPNQEIIMEAKEDKNETNSDNKNELIQEITDSEANKQNEVVKVESKINNEMSTESEDVKENGVKPIQVTGANEHKVRRKKKGKSRRRRTAINKSRETKYDNVDSKEVEDNAINNSEENHIKVDAGVEDQSNQKIADDSKLANENDEGIKTAEGDSIDKEANATDLVKEQSGNSENYKEFEARKNNSENVEEIEMNTNLDKSVEDGVKKPEEKNVGINTEATENGKVSNADEEIGKISKEEYLEKSENSNTAGDAWKDQTVGQ